MSSRLAETRWAPWSGLLLGALAWGLHHQIGSNVVYLRCSDADRWIVLALGAAFVGVTLVAMLLSWMSRGAGQPTEDAVEVRRFVAWISTAGAALFALAILLQTLAGLLSPACAP